ncbi:MAG: hypothetical protein ACFB51_10730 [Anaerolineae bacterium]
MAKRAATTSPGLIKLLRRMTIFQMFLIALVATVVTFILLLVGSPWVAGIVGAEVDTEFWDLLEGFVSVLTASLVIGGGLFALAEYIEAEDARRKADAQNSFAQFERIFEQLMRPDDIAARRWILQHIREHDPEVETQAEWIAATRAVIFPPDGSPSEGRRHIKQMLNTFDYLGFVAFNYWQSAELERLTEWMSPSIAKVWRRIGPYIEWEAERRREPDFYLSAREWGQHCIAWRRKADFPEPVFVEDAL